MFTLQVCQHQTKHCSLFEASSHWAERHIKHRMRHLDLIWSQRRQHPSQSLNSLSILKSFITCTDLRAVILAYIKMWMFWCYCSCACPAWFSPETNSSMKRTFRLQSTKFFSYFYSHVTCFLVLWFITTASQLQGAHTPVVLWILLWFSNISGGTWDKEGSCRKQPIIQSACSVRCAVLFK